VSLLTSLALVVLVVALAPRLGVAGAAAAVAAVEGLRALALSALLRRRGYRQPEVGRLAVPAVLALGALAGVRVLGPLDDRIAAALTVIVAVIGVSVLGLAVLRSTRGDPPGPTRRPADDGSTRPGGRRPGPPPA